MLGRCDCHTSLARTTNQFSQESDGGWISWLRVANDMRRGIVASRFFGHRTLLRNHRRPDSSSTDKMLNHHGSCASLIPADGRSRLPVLRNAVASSVVVDMIYIMWRYIKLLSVIENTSRY